MRILYIDIDSLRADHVGAYGYRRPVSPEIDAVAAAGVRFENYFCADSPCLPSRAALYSGRPGIVSGVVAHENTPEGCQMRYHNRERGGFAPTLPSLLSREGMHTVCFSSFANRHIAGWFHFGHREFHLVSLKNGNEDADEINATAIPWLREHAGEDNWFVHLNYWDPHTLYTEPGAYFEGVARHPAPDWPDATTIARQQGDIGIRTPRSLWAENPHENQGKSRVPTMPDAISSRADFEHLINGYDGAIRYVDEAIGKVLDVLKEQGVYDETVIIISADHGESFGELGQYMEHGAAVPSVCRVPLIVRWPGVTDALAGSACDALLTNIDLAPTLAEMIGTPSPEGWLGQSLAPLLRGAGEFPRRDHIVFSHGLHTRQRSVYDGEWLFVRTYDPSYYTYPPRMLFHCGEDPHLTTDRAEAEPERVARMEALLRSWEEDMVAHSGLPDPMRVIQGQGPFLLGSKTEYLARLAREGRHDDIARLEAIWEKVPTEYAPPPLDGV